MAAQGIVSLYLVHAYLDGDFGWENDNELNKLIYEHGRIQTVPLGVYEQNAEDIHKKLKISGITLDTIKRALQNPGRIVICTVDKYDDDAYPDNKYTLCIGLLVRKI
jgi:hypothetical protein